MNKVIFEVVALVGLTLIAGRKPAEPVSRISSVGMCIAEEMPYQVPEESESEEQEALFAIVVTDEALEELRRISRFVRIAKPV